MDEKINEIVKEMVGIVSQWDDDIRSSKLTYVQLSMFNNTYNGLLGVLGRYHHTLNPDYDEEFANYIMIKKLEKVNIDGVVKLIRQTLSNIDETQIARLIELNNKLTPLYNIAL